MTLRRWSFALVAALAGLLGIAGPASAELGPIQLVSKSPFEQADSAGATALSADGRYLAFEGSIGGLDGVFREDLTTGGLVPVAAAPERAYASAPSISADGRYVSFTTRAALDPADDANEAEDVYVADMATTPPVYELASALDGSTAGLTYEGAGGSRASGRMALSADGRRVAFVTTAASDLTSEPGGSTPGEETPAGQVAVRDLTTGRTTLVSAERDPETGAMTERPVKGGAMILKPTAPPPGAALSADGSTVAWLAGHLPAQVPLLPGESGPISQLDELDTVPYDEPLWRRVTDGQAAPTRRIIGGGDLSFPAMTNKFEGLNPAASGWLGLQGVDGTPQLSADGNTVALIGNPTEAANVFLVNMAPGLSRTQAVRRLTRETPVNPNLPNLGINLISTLPLNGHIFDLAISADGRRLAFTTARQQFPLAPPNLVTPPPGQVGLVELYLMDLEGETLQRVTHGTGGEGEASLAPTVVNGLGGDGATSPSFDAAADLMAFSSDASNLVAGDGNEASDAFTVTATSDDRSSTPVRISPGPRRRGKKRGGLTLSAFSLPHGGVRLVALVPGPGSLQAEASAPPFAGAAVSRAPRTLARGRRRTHRTGKVKLDLVLPPRLRRFAHTREGVYALVRAGFHRRGRKTLHAQLQVRFHAHAAKKKRSGK